MTQYVNIRYNQNKGECMLKCKEYEYFLLGKTKTLELACKPDKDGKLNLFFTNGFSSDHIIIYEDGSWASDGILAIRGVTYPKSLMNRLNKFINDNKNLIR